jgi:hypothetical protein
LWTDASHFQSELWPGILAKSLISKTAYPESTGASQVDNMGTYIKIPLPVRFPTPRNPS